MACTKTCLTTCLIEQYLAGTQPESQAETQDFHSQRFLKLAVKQPLEILAGTHLQLSHVTQGVTLLLSVALDGC